MSSVHSIMEPKEPQDELGVASPPQESPALEKATDEDMEMHRKWNVAFREKVNDPCVVSSEALSP